MKKHIRRLKQLVNSPVMSYFDIRNETQLIVDASPVGLSVILTQRPPGKNTPPNVIARAVASALIGGGGGGGGIFIYSCYARRISFEISCF